MIYFIFIICLSVKYNTNENIYLCAWGSQLYFEHVDQYQEKQVLNEYSSNKWQNKEVYK